MVSSWLLLTILLEVSLVDFSLGGGAKTEGALKNYNLEKSTGNCDGKTVEIPMGECTVITCKNCDDSKKNCKDIGKLRYLGKDVLYFDLITDNTEDIKNSFKIGSQKLGELRAKFHYNGLWHNLLITEGGNRKEVEPIPENAENVGEDSSD